MRRAAKVDLNQSTIVQALRKAGVSVLHLHQLGNGVPDILAGFRGRNVLMEIKRPGGKTNDLQDEFRAAWKGAVYIVRTPEHAVELMINAKQTA